MNSENTGADDRKRARGKRNTVLRPYNKRLMQRFFGIVAIYLASVFALWFFCYMTIFSNVRENTAEMVTLISNNLVDKLNGEFSRMKTATSTIAASVYVQDFLSETDKNAYYEKVGAVSEIIRKATYTHMGEDSVITITDDGAFYRFTGSVSNNAISRLHQDILSGMAVYSVAELDGAGYFCMVSPVYARGTGPETPIGYVVALSHLAKVHRMLDTPDTARGIDTAVILDDTVLFSSNPELEGKSADELNRLYGSVTVTDVTGSSLHAAAAVTKDALRYGEQLFISVAGITLVFLLITVFVLSRVLSAQIVSPTMRNADDMRMGLLQTQIDAHFVVNTIDCIRGLAEKGQTDKIVTASENLADMLKSRHDPEAEANVIAQMADIQRYVDIMNIRRGDKFDVTLDADDLFRYRMPSQILQPLVENALTHGLGNKPDDCRLTVTGTLENNCIRFDVADNGKGIPPVQLAALQDVLDTADDWESTHYSLKGVALVNIQRRIRAECGEEYGLTLRETPGGGLTVTVRLPVIRETQDRAAV